MSKLKGSLERHNEIRDQLGLNVDEVEAVTGLSKTQLAKMWDQCIPRFKESDKYVGQIIVFGTGNSEK